MKTLRPIKNVVMKTQTAIQLVIYHQTIDYMRCSNRNQVELIKNARLESELTYFDYLQLVGYAYRVVICCDYDIGDLSWSVVHKRSAKEMASIASCVIALISLSILLSVLLLPKCRNQWNAHTQADIQQTHTHIDNSKVKLVLGLYIRVTFAFRCCCC